MSFRKITQQEITNANFNGDEQLVNKLSKKYIKQHRTSKFKRFNKWLITNSSSISIYISLLALIISKIALFK